MPPQSIIANVSGVVTTIIKVEGTALPQSYTLLSINVIKELNKISTARIEFFDGGTTGSQDFEIGNSDKLIPGKKIEIQAGYANDNEIIYKGIIVRHSVRLNASGRFLLQIDCKHPVVKTTAGRKNRVFDKKKDSDIIKEILGEYSDIGTVQVTSTAEPYAEVVQHYTTDWDFLMMRADINGLVVNTGDDKIDFSKPNPSQQPNIRIGPTMGMIDFQAEIDARHQTKKVDASSWDITEQKIIKTSKTSSGNVSAGRLGTEQLADVLGLDSFLLQTAAGVPLQVLEAWAESRHQKSKLSKIRGTTTIFGYPHVFPGETVEIEGLSEQFNGNCYVSGVQHILEEGDWKTILTLGLTPGAYSEETPGIDSPSASGLFSGMKGLHTGIVKQIHEDPDGQYRVKVAIPTLHQDNLGIWARLANFYATGESGLFFYPEISDEVIVGFLNEDPMHPVILGSLYSKSKQPPLQPEDGNNFKSLVTRSKMKLTFDEEKKIITIETPGGNIITLDDDQGMISITDLNNNTAILNEDGITMETPSDFVIRAQGNITMEAQGNIDMKASQNLTQEAMSVEAKGSTKFAAQGAQAEINGSAQTVIKGGVVMIN